MRDKLTDCGYNAYIVGLDEVKKTYTLFIKWGKPILVNGYVVA